MQELQITHSRKNKQNVITHVQIDDAVYEIMEIVTLYRRDTHQFYTLVNGYRSPVFPKRMLGGNWFLTTSPDGIEENNLKSLPIC